MQQLYPLTTGDVLIEDHVWIGAGTIIMPGVRIGRCSIIAANSFLVGIVEPYSMYGGNPAKMIRKLEELRQLDDHQD
jgi:acetyltransferase-like isoleucine patch superfamily enzyme